ncbi:uncharacterized protein LOC142766871 [Rhipicephalus microplus]|uniref:uncharacterized protein LOC142766871 n=1 Tax=Rhipicephalus microplus TaxID=6941 RepID=UPI003F6A8697
MVSHLPMQPQLDALEEFHLAVFYQAAFEVFLTILEVSLPEYGRLFTDNNQFKANQLTENLVQHLIQILDIGHIVDHFLNHLLDHLLGHLHDLQHLVMCLPTFGGSRFIRILAGTTADGDCLSK